jgi:hypothetical protein
MEVSMRRSGFGLLIGLLVALVGFPVQAQPKAGFWNSGDGDFAAGEWQEELLDCHEGQPGNIISAGSENVYVFDGAQLEKVTLVKDTEKFTQYRTLYLGGTLKLFNKEDLPWYNEDDPAEDFLADVKQAIVTTWKFKDELGDYNKKMAFLITFDAKFQDSNYACYSVRVMADYKGTPALQTGNGCAIGDMLNGAKIAILGPMKMPVDVKPGSCPNPLNFKSKGVLPVAILGTPWLRVKTINPRTITLMGVSPLRWSWEDVGTPVDSFFCHDNPCDTDCGEPGDCDKPCGGYECNELGPDGNLDLVLKFDTQKIVEQLNLFNLTQHRALVPLILEGKLYKGLCITGQDSVVILNKP